jgi:hypothetical protein
MSGVCRPPVFVASLPAAYHGAVRMVDVLCDAECEP